MAHGRTGDAGRARVRAEERGRGQEGAPERKQRDGMEEDRTPSLVNNAD